MMARTVFCHLFRNLPYSNSEAPAPCGVCCQVFLTPLYSSCGEGCVQGSTHPFQEEQTRTWATPGPSQALSSPNMTSQHSSTCVTTDTHKRAHAVCSCRWTRKHLIQDALIPANPHRPNNILILTNETTYTDQEKQLTHTNASIYPVPPTR